MIMELKICTTGKMFGKICLKAVRDFLEFFLEYFVRVFFPIWGLKSREGWSEA